MKLAFSAWVALMALGTPGPVMLMHCDDTTRIVGYSMHKSSDFRATTLADIQFALDADEWEKDRVRELLAWGEFCWSREGCVVNGQYDPPPPPMKCKTEPMS